MPILGSASLKDDETIQANLNRKLYEVMVSDGKIYTLKIGYNRILNERARAREKLV